MAKLITYSDSLRSGKMCKVKRGLCNVLGEYYESSMVLSSWVKWVAGEPIQDAAPELDANQREFWISGFTPAEWDRIFKGK